MTAPYFIGIDVGTRSVRAALVCIHGVLCVHVEPITVFNPLPNFYEQSSIEIWDAVSVSVKKVTERVSNKCEIKGIGFDATCSLVLLDEFFKPVNISKDDKNTANIIMWMDHRAKEEAEIINSHKSRAHDYVGGKIFLEMELPKLLWLKRNLSKQWSSAKHLFDLPDYLTFQATGCTSRSLCSLVCKWTYLCDEKSQGWDQEFLCKVGLEDLTLNNFERIGNVALVPGQKCGGLTKESAEKLGLLPGTAVAASIIDAHAGGLSLVSVNADSKESCIGKLALICGTSTCHMCVNMDPIFVPGVWGPYFNAMVPNLWLLEAGQSATGSLVDHIVFSHSAIKNCPENEEPFQWLEAKLDQMAKENDKEVCFLTEDLHVYPDFHGNRSPLADPDMKGMIYGLTLDNSIENLALLYLATIQAISYGTKDIVNQLISSGQKINSIAMCGGLVKSPLFIQTNADVIGMPTLIPDIKEAVLHGAAMLGASASGCFGAEGDVASVAQCFGGKARVVQPNPKNMGFHQKKFLVYKKMQNDVCAYKTLMKK